MSRELVLATGNAGKVRELNQLLSDIGWHVRPQSDFGVPEADETGLTFVENAIIKARNAALHSGLPAVADDSGIEVDALNGAPGIRSARYGGEPGNDARNNAKLLGALNTVDDADRTARFRCCMVFLRHPEDPAPIIAEGVWEGMILREGRGANGFGYDPLFLVPELGLTSAELTPADKNRLSHRARAVRTLVERLGA